MAADDGPRETLIRDLKYERLARSLVYRTLNQAVASFLVSPTRDRRILIAARETLVAERDASQNPRQRENIVYELRALDAFEASLNALSLTGWTLERVPVGGHRLDVEGVRINVRPTVRIRLRKLRGADQVGALLVDVAKGQAPKTDESAARVANAMTHSAIVLHQYVVDTLPEDGSKPSLDHTIVFHSHRQQAVTAPTNHKRRYRNIEAACRSVASRWDSIKPPPAFDPAAAVYRD